MVPARHVSCDHAPAGNRKQRAERLRRGVSLPQNCFRIRKNAVNVFFDPKIDDAQRREELYCGSIFVYTPFPAALKLCAFAQQLIEEAFDPHDPRKVHEKMPVEQCVEILAELKPRFIHHPTSKLLLREMLAERGCDAEKTYFDVPRLRTAFP